MSLGTSLIELARDFVSASTERRRQNIRDALAEMMKELGDGCLFGGFFNSADDRYAKILPTTWKYLSDHGWIQDHGYNRVELTGRGWREGIRALQLNDDPQFRAKMSSLAATLKRCVKGRQREEFIDVFSAAQESELTPEFVVNVIESKVLDNCFNMQGAHFAHDDHNRYLIIVPIDFGLPPL
jgi:hypothetical protein